MRLEKSMKGHQYHFIHLFLLYSILLSSDSLYLRVAELDLSNVLFSPGVGIETSLPESEAMDSLRLTSWIMLRLVGFILGETGSMTAGFVTTDPTGEDKGMEGRRDEVRIEVKR